MSTAKTKQLRRRLEAAKHARRMEAARRKLERRRQAEAFLDAFAAPKDSGRS